MPFLLLARWYLPRFYGPKFSEARSSDPTRRKVCHCDLWVLRISGIYLFKNNVIVFLHNVSVLSTCNMARVESEDHLWESILSFYHVGITLLLSDLAASTLTHWAILPAHLVSNLLSNLHEKVKAFRFWKHAFDITKQVCLDFEILFVYFNFRSV